VQLFSRNSKRKSSQPRFARIGGEATAIAIPQFLLDRKKMRGLSILWSAIDNWWNGSRSTQLANGLPAATTQPWDVLAAGPRHPPEGPFGMWYFRHCGQESLQNQVLCPKGQQFAQILALSAPASLDNYGFYTLVPEKCTHTYMNRLQINYEIYTNIPIARSNPRGLSAKRELLVSQSFVLKTAT
jgi:hypothetical protein